LTVNVVKNLPFLAGLSGRNEPPVDTSRVGCGDVVSCSWMNDELVQDTRQVWSQAYGRVVSEDEAMEILTNVKRLAEVLMDVQRRNSKT
jgi:hypothetical protein